MTLDLWEEREALRDVWRCVTVRAGNSRENGRLSVIKAGATMKQELCADNLDFQKTQEVSLDIYNYTVYILGLRLS